MKDYKWLIIAAVLLIGLWFYNTPQVPKEAVADIEGKACAVDKDCPCMGKYNYSGTNYTAFGIGVGSCESNKCNMQYCVGLEPVGTWGKENIIPWIKSNILLVAALVALLIFLLAWPKA